MGDVSEAAKAKAVALANVRPGGGWGSRDFETNGAFAALARYIQAASDALRECGFVGSPETPNALLPFILPEPVDPLLIEARKMFAGDHRRGSADFFDHGIMLKDGAGESVIMAGEMDGNGMLKRYLIALRRGMELAQEQRP